MESELLSLTKAAEVIGVSRSTAHRWATEGRLPVVRDGDRRVRVPRRALGAWLEDQERQAIESLGASND